MSQSFLIKVSSSRVKKDLPKLSTERRFDCTTQNPSTIDVMVDSSSKKRRSARYKLPSSGNLFLVRAVIYDKIERM